MSINMGGPVIILFLTMIYLVLTLSISHKESGIYSRIGVVAQSEHTALYGPLFGNVCYLFRHRMLPYLAPYAPLFGTVCSLVRHRMLPCSAPYAPLFGTVCFLFWHHMLPKSSLFSLQNTKNIQEKS